MAAKTTKKKTTKKTAKKAAKKPQVKYKVLDDVAKPLENAYEGDVGFDLVSTINRTVSSTQTIKIPTGIQMEMPDDVWASIREKSGVSLTSALSVKAGVVDPGYRGEIQVIVYNHGFDPMRINRGDKIAQIIFHKVLKVDTEKVEEINEETERGDKGFGSSDG